MTGENRRSLLSHADKDSVIAWRTDGRAIRALELFQDARWLAEQLPTYTYQVNLCQDRYRFLVTLVAALYRRQTLLLPSSLAPEDVDRLKEQHNSLYCVVDSAYECAGLEAFQFIADPESRTADLKIPDFPTDTALAKVYTSGSDRSATPHLKTWGMLYKGAELTGRRLGLDQMAGASLVATVPPQHMYGLETSIMLPLRWGLAVAVQRPLFTADIAAALECLPEPRLLVTTPLFLRSMVEGNTVFPNLEFILSATSPLHRELAQRVEQLHKTHVLEIYGSTETGAVATRRPACDDDWYALPGVSLEQKNARWWCSAEQLPEPVALNDRIEQKSRGRFRLLGRDADLIKIAGKRASLADLNHKLQAIDGVTDSVLFLPDATDERTARLAGFAVAPELDKRQIIDALRHKLDPAFLPRPFFLVQALPRSATGKLSRQRLIALLEQYSRPSRNL